MPESLRYTLLICTCDAYEDAWGPLFTLFRKYWPGLDVPIVLNTETKTYECPGYTIRCPRLYKGYPHPSIIPWSRRLRETLTQAVNTELVMLFLDDFYLCSPVDETRLDICLHLIEDNPKIANVELFPCPPPFTPTAEYPWLVKRDKSAPYLFSLQAGLWRRQRLLHFLRDHESPWYFERWGSLRGRRYPDDFYAIAANDAHDVIFDYDPTKHGLTGGRWRPETGSLFVKEGINLDLTVRGMMSTPNTRQRRRRNWFTTTWNIFRSLRP
ncbi:hypothetical protein ANRL4_03430 [Anaerolineae bacterium]|nr:hypothetical protein ANRL4_03430 [Anaerolineae bacterium]